MSAGVDNAPGAEGYDFERIKVNIRNQVATVLMQWPDGGAMHEEPDGGKTFHTEFPKALQRLRDDDSVRIVVLRGAKDKYFLSPVDVELPEPLGIASKGVLIDPPNTYAAIRENAETLETIVSMEKPVVAMVNGHALSIGASIAMVSDIIIANEEAYIADTHISGVSYFVSSSPKNSGIVPGDGGTVIWPLQMSLAKAKEFLFTGRPVKAKELAAMNAINAAVPLSELQGTVDRYVGELLQRPAWALAWTKVAINKRLKQNLNLTLDLSVALEGLSMRARQANLKDGKSVTTL